MILEVDVEIINADVFSFAFQLHETSLFNNHIFSLVCTLKYLTGLRTGFDPFHVFHRPKRYVLNVFKGKGFHKYATLHNASIQ